MDPESNKADEKDFQPGSEESARLQLQLSRDPRISRDPCKTDYARDEAAAGGRVATVSVLRHSSRSSSPGVSSASGPHRHRQAI